MVDGRDDPHRGGIVPTCHLFLSRLLRHHRRHTSCLNDVPRRCTQRSDRFGEEAAERDGSDADDDAPPHLTGDYRQSPVQILSIPT